MLDHITTAELIEALATRKSFRGLLVYQVSDFSGVDSDDWRWRSNNCDAHTVASQIAATLAPQPAAIEAEPATEIAAPEPPAAGPEASPAEEDDAN